MIIDVPALRQLWEQAFGDTQAYIDGFFHTGFCPDRCGCIYQDGQLAAALFWFDCLWQKKKLAYVYAVATEKAFRGRGMCRKLMEQTHNHLKAEGYTGAVLVPGNEGLYSMYGKMGYRGFCPMEKKLVMAAGESVQLRLVSPDAYGQLRQVYLPEDAVVQERALLQFAAGFVDFYTDGECLFCGTGEADTFYFQEFLGDPEKIPGILKALGVKKGIVRLSGGEKPFAMYHKLTHDLGMPSYFGIALD